MAAKISAVSGVLLDVTGVLYESGGGAIAGSVQAVANLRSAGYKLVFCTNESAVCRDALVQRLRGLGFSLEAREVHSPAPAARHYLSQHRLRPFLLVHPDALPDYQGLDTSSPNAVVVGDAASAFTYTSLNQAFRILIDSPGGGTPLISLGTGRYYREGGHLTLDVGPFTKALEYAAGVEAVVIGKPERHFFLSALQQLQVNPQNAVMIGDDVLSDVGAAQQCGMRAVLVRTGKYSPGDETRSNVRPDWTVDNLEQAVDMLLSNTALSCS